MAERQEKQEEGLRADGIGTQRQDENKREDWDCFIQMRRWKHKILKERNRHLEGEKNQGQTGRVAEPQCPAL